jgi:hypothetical protein
MPARIITTFLATLLALGGFVAARAADAVLVGHWRLNHELTEEVQPDAPRQRDVPGNLPRPSVSVGGVPLPTPGGGQPPPVAGNPRDPKVLHSTTLTIRPVGDDLELTYAGAQSDRLKRGDDQGLISRWSDRKLTSRYATTSRKVSQVYEVRSDGRLLVTVKLNPNDGPTLVHKRVFDPADPP